MRNSSSSRRFALLVGKRRTMPVAAPDPAPTVRPALVDMVRMLRRADRRFRSGLVHAPFLGMDGYPRLLAIAEDGRLQHVGDMRPPQWKVDRRATVLALAESSLIIAPWRLGEATDEQGALIGRCLLALDAKRRIVATADVAASTIEELLEGLIDARQDLEALLEGNAAGDAVPLPFDSAGCPFESWECDDGDEDEDEDDSGDEWKR